jgi:hypothetical protein
MTAQTSQVQREKSDEKASISSRASSEFDVTNKRYQQDANKIG